MSRSSGSPRATRGHVDGAVTFHEIGPRLTRILLVLQYHPQGFFEQTGNLWRAAGRRARLELKHYRRHVMSQVLLHPDEVTGWRGVIQDGEVVQDHESRLREEDDAEHGDDEYRDQDEAAGENDEDYEGGGQDDAADDDYEDDAADDEYEDEDEDEDAAATARRTGRPTTSTRTKTTTSTKTKRRTRRPATTKSRTPPTRKTSGPMPAGGGGDDHRCAAERWRRAIVQRAR